jgi:death-on-curing protein
VDDFVCPTYEHLVLVNQTLVARYGGAGHHVRDGGPLHNALHLVQGPIFGVDQFPTLVEKACKIAHAIATGHVFTDGNKKTAASVLDLVLNLNGCALQVPQDDLVEVMYRLARNDLTIEEFVAWTRERLTGPAASF